MVATFPPKHPDESSRRPATIERIREADRHEHHLTTYRDEQIVIVAGRVGWSTWLWEGLDYVTVCRSCPQSDNSAGIKVLSYGSRVDGVATRFAKYLRDIR